MKRARLHRSLWQEAGRAFRAAIRSSRNSGQVPGAASGLRFPNQTCRVRPKNGCGLRHLPLAFAGSGLFRRKARARTVPSSSGVWHSLLPLSALSVTGFGGAVPPASGFGRCRHARVSGNAHKPLTSQEKTNYG